MSVAVLLAVGDAFLGLVLRRAIRDTLPRAGTPEEARNGTAAAAALATRSFGLLVLDRGLPDAWPILTAPLARRTGPTILVGEGPVPATAGRVAVLDGPAVSLPARFGSVLAGLQPASRVAPPPAAQEVATTLPRPARALSVPPALILIACSTGGPAVLASLLRGLPAPAIPVLIAQHMPADQTAPLAAWLSEATGTLVTEQAGGPLPPSGVAILRGGQDWRLVHAADGGLLVRPALAEGPYHPSADALLGSAAALGLPAAALVLTGMGRDGAEGAARMQEAGAIVLVQTPESCAVPGMPAAALESVGPGGATALPPAGLAARLRDWIGARA